MLNKPQDKRVNKYLIFVFLAPQKSVVDTQKNHLSEAVGSFEHLKHILQLMDKKSINIFKLNVFVYPCIKML